MEEGELGRGLVEELGKKKEKKKGKKVCLGLGWKGREEGIERKKGRKKGLGFRVWNSF